mmetsp:Transcript_16408/g.40536  ORF Transcript_16408/g.40536 Transcript_16408/m.40536 type:complete len:325 (+) Transcript_16408:97-1071(+)
MVVDSGFCAGDIVYRELEGMRFPAVVLRVNPDSPPEDDDAYDIVFADDVGLELAVPKKELERADRSVLSSTKTGMNTASSSSTSASTSASASAATTPTGNGGSASGGWSTSSSSSMSDDAQIVDEKILLQRGLRRLYQGIEREETVVVNSGQRGVDSAGNRLVGADGVCLVACSDSEQGPATSDQALRAGGSLPEDQAKALSLALDGTRLPDSEKDALPSARLGVMFDGTAASSGAGAKPRNSYLKHLNKQDHDHDPNSNSKPSTAASDHDGQASETSPAEEEEPACGPASRGVRALKQSKERTGALVTRESLFVQSVAGAASA